MVLTAKCQKSKKKGKTRSFSTRSNDEGIQIKKDWKSKSKDFSVLLVKIVKYIHILTQIDVSMDSAQSRKGNTVLGDEYKAKIEKKMETYIKQAWDSTHFAL